MKSLRFALFLALLPTQLLAQPLQVGSFPQVLSVICEYHPYPPQVATRTVSVDGHWYQVRYEYVSYVCTIPATNPPGKPHYGAKITVFRLEVNGTMTQIGEPFGGQYVEGGCFEDRPEDMVRQALKVKRK